MDNKIFYSAKDIITRSCMQLKYFSTLSSEELAKAKAPTKGMAEGIRFQDEVAKEFPGCLQEMCGSIDYGSYRLFFSNDIVTNDGRIFEVKSLRFNEGEEFPTWYLHNSILQCAFYKAFILYGANSLHTASFAVKEYGYEYTTITIPYDEEYYLRFGNDIYKIDITDSSPFIDFIYEKLIAIQDWDSAREFDSKYKRKEYDMFSQYITVSKNVTQ